MLVTVIVSMQANADDVIIKNISGNCSGSMTFSNSKKVKKFNCNPQSKVSGMYYIFQNNGRVMFNFWVMPRLAI